MKKLNLMTHFSSLSLPGRQGQGVGRRPVQPGELQLPPGREGEGEAGRGGGGDGGGRRIQ